MSVAPEAAAESGLAVEREAGRWTVVLDRPQKANALSAELVEALIALLARAQAERVPILAFRGHGRNFSAGFDFTGYESQSEGDLLLRFVRLETLLQGLARSPCATMAFAHGRNFGAGVDLFAACRWRIAAPESTFRMPGLGFGLVLGTRRFASIVGREAAREILEGLETFDAQRAHSLGFVREIAAVEDWPAVAERLGRRAEILSMEARNALDGALDFGVDEADMADLVRSAAQPGLKTRIRDYLARQRKTPAGPSP